MESNTPNFGLEWNCIVQDVRTINLPAELCRQAEKKFRGQFESLEALLQFILRDLLNEEAAQADESEQKLIEQRLRDLGYL